MSHYIAKCKHGTVMGQCRCPGPKDTRLVPCPPEHGNTYPVAIAHEPPTGLPQPPSGPAAVYPGVSDYARAGERRAIVAFLRKQSTVAAGVAASPNSALMVVAAYLVDVAQMVENGDHLG